MSCPHLNLDGSPAIRAGEGDDLGKMVCSNCREPLCLDCYRPEDEHNGRCPKQDEWNVPIDEEWLRASGFKWHEFERSGGKHWVLWMGSCIAAVEQKRTGTRWMFTGDEDLGIELAAGVPGGDGWFCWLRDDAGGRYHRFIHLKHVYTRLELVRLIEGITGLLWKPENHRFGSIHTDEQMERIRREDERLDRAMLRQNAKWYDVEKDDSRGRALPEHMEAAEKCRSEHKEQNSLPGKKTDQ